MNHNFDDFIFAINSLHAIPDAAARAIRERLQQREYRRGKLLTRGDGMNNDLYFIFAGVIRGFVQEEMRDVTTWICCENELVMCIGVSDAGTREEIEVIEDCTLIILRDADLQYLSSQYPAVGEMLRNLLRRHCIGLKNRLLMMRPAKAEQKYSRFLHYHGHLANRVLLKYISSFLGITQETLSRVRAKINAKR